MKKVFSPALILLCFLCLAPSSFASIYDDFNDGVIDQNKWWPWNQPSPVIQLQEYGGSLNIDGSSNNRSRYGGLSSTAIFGGDFDIRMRWQDWSYNGNTGPYLNDVPQVGFQIAPRGKTDTDSVFLFRSTFPDGTNRYVSNAEVNGALVQTGGATTSATAGYFRIARQGSTISSYYSTDNQNWNNLLTVNNAFTDPVMIQPKGYTGDYTNSFHAEWDYVDVQSQTAMPPQSTPPTLPPTEPIREKNSTSGLINLNNYPIDPNKPSIILVHGRQGSSEDWPTTMSSSLIERLNEANYNILAWDWRDAANYPTYLGQDLANLYSNAMMQGSKLTTELINRNLINSDIHLIGHSAGGALIDETAATLLRLGFDKVEHLTFLDPLDPADTLNGSNAVWADNYYSSLIDALPTFIGSPVRNTYHDFLGINSHNYPIEWYNNTITNNSEREGFFWSKEGGGWNQRPSVISTAPITTASVETFDSLGSWEKSGNVYFSDGIAYLKESSPAFLFEDITFPFNVSFLSFDFRFMNPGDGDLLKLYFDDQFLFAYEGSYFLGNDFMSSGMIDISRFSDRSGKLIFALDNYGETNAEIGIDNLRLYQASPVPEPSTCVLLLTGLFGVLGLKKILRDKQ